MQVKREEGREVDLCMLPKRALRSKTFQQLHVWLLRTMCTAVTAKHAKSTARRGPIAVQALINPLKQDRNFTWFATILVRIEILLTSIPSQRSRDSVTKRMRSQALNVLTLFLGPMTSKMNVAILLCHKRQ